MCNQFHNFLSLQWIFSKLNNNSILPCVMVIPIIFHNWKHKSVFSLICLKTRKGTDILNSTLMLKFDNTHWHRQDFQVNEFSTFWSELRYLKIHGPLCRKLIQSLHSSGYMMWHLCRCPFNTEQFSLPWGEYTYTKSTSFRHVAFMSLSIQSVAACS